MSRVVDPKTASAALALRSAGLCLALSIAGSAWAQPASPEPAPTSDAEPEHVDPLTPSNSLPAATPMPASSASENQQPRQSRDTPKATAKRVKQPPQSNPMQRANRRGWVVVPRLALPLSAGGTLTAEAKCSNWPLACPPGGSGEFNEVSRVGLSLDVLAELSSWFRVGVGLMSLPRMKLEPKEAPPPDNSSADEGAPTDLTVGTTLDAALVGELVVRERAGMTARVIVGTELLFPAGELQDDIDLAQQGCAQLEADGWNCRVRGKPYVGHVLGLGAGFLAPVSEAVHLRFDAGIFWYGVPGPSQSVWYDYQSVTSSYSFSGSRFWLLAGAEL